MFCFFISFVYPKPKIFFFLLFSWSASEELCKGSWREHSWDRWSELTKGIFHTIECPVRSWEELPRRLICFWEGESGIGHQVLSNCLVHPLFVSFFIIIFITIYLYYSILLYFHLLDRSYLNMQVLLWFYSPFHWDLLGKKGVRQTTVWHFFSSWA